MFSPSTKLKSSELEIDYDDSHAFGSDKSFALGISDPEEIEHHYQRWVQLSGLNEVELIDLEIGYQTGLEVGNQYKTEHL